MAVAERTKASLAGIVVHPLRIRSLIAFTERKASVAELSKDFGVDQGTLAYHVKKLLEDEAIEEVDSRPVRGSTEVFYRAVQRPLISDEETAELPEQKRLEWLERIFELIVADVTTSLVSGKFIERHDHNFIRFPTSVDEEGWVELRMLLAETLERAMDIEAKSAGRMVEDPESKSIPVRVVTMAFEI